MNQSVGGSSRPFKDDKVYLARVQGKDLTTSRFQGKLVEIKEVRVEE